MTSQCSRIAIDQSHRYGRHQAPCREPAGSYDKTTRIAICFEHKTQYLSIRAPYTRIVVFWHNSHISPMISQSQINCNTPTLYIAAIFVRYYYTQPAVGCYNSWANLRCSGCYPLGEKLLWNRSILRHYLCNKIVIVFCELLNTISPCCIPITIYYVHFSHQLRYKEPAC